MENCQTIDIGAQIKKISEQIHEQLVTVPEKAHLFIKSILSDIERNPETYDKVFEFLKKEFVDARGYEAGKAWGTFLHAWIYLKQGENELAIRAFDEALGIFNEFDDFVGTARTTNGIGVCYMYQSNFTMAIEQFLKAIEISEQIEWEEGVSTASSNLGIVYYQLKNYEEADRYLLRSLEYQGILANNKVVARSYRASIMVEQNRMQEALKLFMECLEDCKTYGFVFTEIDIQNRFALLLEKRDNRKAESLLNASLAQAKNANNPRLLAESTLNLAELHFKNRNYEEAEKYTKEILELTATNRLPILQTKAKELKAKILAEQGDWQLAYKMLMDSYDEDKALFNEKLVGQSFAAHENRLSTEKNHYELEIRRLRLISETGTMIASAMDYKTIGSVVYSKLKDLMPINAFALGLADLKRGELTFEYFVENNVEGEPFTSHIDNKDSLAAYCIRNNQDILIRDIFKDYSNYVEKTQYIALDNNDPVHSLMFCPIIIGNTVRGVLTAQAKQIGVYKKHHLETLHALAAYAGVAIQNAKLFHDVQTLATTDPLTGVANRRKFMDSFFMEIERSSRYGNSLSFIMFDIDLFKRVNDTYGHTIGDIVLQKSVKLAKENLRTTDIIGRYGGEEFTILLPNTHLEGAKIVAERMRNAFEQAEIEALPGKAVTFTASFGLAEFKDGDTMDGLLARADNALYYAKETGRNKVSCER